MACASFHPVAAVAVIPDQEIVACAPFHDVIALAANQCIVAIIALQNVDLLIPFEGIVYLAATKVFDADQLVLNIDAIHLIVRNARFQIGVNLERNIAKVRRIVASAAIGDVIAIAAL